MKTTRTERETIFRWDEEENVVHIYSASPVIWRKLARLGVVPQKETRFRTGEPLLPLVAAVDRFISGFRGKPPLRIFKRPSRGAAVITDDVRAFVTGWRARARTAAPPAPRATRARW